MKRPRVRLGFYVAFTAAAATAVAAGCSLTKLAADQTIDVLAAAVPSFNRESDVGLAENAVFSNLKLLEGLMTVSPKNKKVYVLTSETFGSYAFGFLDPKIESIRDPNDPTRKVLVTRAINFYGRARGYAEKWLSFKVKDVSAKLHGDKATALATIAAMDKKLVPGLFWTGYNWAQLINLRVDSSDDAPPPPEDDSGEVTTVKGTTPAGGGLAEAELDIAKAIMARVAALDETYFNASAHTVLGVMAGAVPASLGGVPADALKSFDRAIALTGGKFLLPKVFKAQFWAVGVGDKAAFKALLDEVLKAPADLDPEQRLANELAKGRAAALLARIDELFIS